MEYQEQKLMIVMRGTDIVKRVWVKPGKDNNGDYAKKGFSLREPTLAEASFEEQKRLVPRSSDQWIE